METSPYGENLTHSDVDLDWPHLTPHWRLSLFAPLPKGQYQWIALDAFGGQGIC